MQESPATHAKLRVLRRAGHPLLPATTEIRKVAGGKKNAGLSGYHFGNIVSVRVISKAAIREFVKKHADALEPLMHWYYMAKRARWSNLADAKRDFSHADAVGEHTVFNIAGNKYRLIAAIKYRYQIIYIRRILTHAEYDKGKWK
jgi:mRNA interferase HigB